MSLATPHAVELSRTIVRAVKNVHATVVLCPSFPALPGVAEALKGTSVHLGAQDLFWGSRGAFTGEVAAEDLRALGCRFVLVGHSERRRFLGETDEMVNKKVLAALGHGLSPVLCVGESAGDRQRHLEHHVVSQQVHLALKNVPPPRFHQALIVAYEPLWAISPGRPAEPRDAHEMAGIVHQALVDAFGERVVGASTMIIYGGSVDGGNVGEYVDRDLIQGVLVGAASTHAQSFDAILKSL